MNAKKHEVPEALLASLLADYKKPEDLIGENGLLKQLTKLLVEKALDAELTEHLGHGKNELVANAAGKVIYTTNAIESVNMSLRKLTKNRGSFPSDEALMKLFYLALRNISQKWTMPIRDWKAALTRFTIQFEERIPQM
jgi:transposase-like protein